MPAIHTQIDEYLQQMQVVGARELQVTQARVEAGQPILPQQALDAMTAELEAAHGLLILARRCGCTKCLTVLHASIEHLAWLQEQLETFSINLDLAQMRKDSES